MAAVIITPLNRPHIATTYGFVYIFQFFILENNLEKIITWIPEIIQKLYGMLILSEY